MADPLATVLAALLAFVVTLGLGQFQLAGDHSVAGAGPRSEIADSINSSVDRADTFAVDGFATNWAGSANGAYAVSGTVYRIRQAQSARLYGSPIVDLAGAEVVLDYHHRQTERMEVTRLGTMLTVVDEDGGERTCRMIESVAWCSGTDRRPIDLERRRAAEVMAVVDNVSGPDASHRAHPLAAGDIESELGIILVSADGGGEPRCWEARALTGDQGHRWGRRAQFCFDRSTGALIFRRIFGQSRIEVFVADDVAV